MNSSARQMLQRLEAASVPEDVIAVLERLQKAGFEAYLAGGCVRDALLGRESNDYDVATSALPQAVLPLFARVIPTGLQHGTVTVLSGPQARHVEVTTFRGEGEYLDGRRPQSVSFISDIEADLARRDFTVNALAWDPVGRRLVDPFGGVADAARRRIRAVGEALKRFSEDGLRPLRAVRFASVLGFGLDARTKEAIGQSLETFRKVAVERVQDEFAKLLVRSPKPSKGLRLLADTGLLGEFAPELLEGIGVVQNRWHRWTVWEHTLRTVDHAPARLEVRLAALLHDVAKPRCAAEKGAGEYSFHRHESVGAELSREMLERLRFPKKVVDAVSKLVFEHNWYYSPEWSDGTVRRHLARLEGEPFFGDFFDLRTADIRAHGVAVSEGLKNLAALRARFETEIAKAHALSLKDLALDGRRLMSELGMAPGPRVGETLRALLNHVLDTPEDNTEERLLELARSLTPPQ